LGNTPEAKRALEPTIVIGHLNDLELGLSFTELMDEHREAMGIYEEISGVLVTHVIDGSPAQRARIKGCDKKVTQGEFECSIGGDIIIEADGKRTGTIQEFEKWSESKPTESNLKIYRNGSIIDVTLLK
jgi:S1-C subfamily serine protease